MEQSVSRSRDEIKGLAILWVVLFHAEYALPGLAGFVQQIGYGGVDLFFFLTGFGLYRSLEKNSDLRSFALRRVRRLLPAYLPVLALWAAVRLPACGLSPTELLRSLCGSVIPVGFWLGAPTIYNWYMDMLLLTIVLAPLCHALISRSPHTGRTLLCLLAAAFLAGLTLIGQEAYMGLSRLPVFLLGMALGSGWRPRLKPWLSRLLLWAAALAGLAVLWLLRDQKTLLYDYGLYWHPFVLLAPGLCAGIGWLTRRLPALAPLRLIGQSSFEIYLLNIFMCELASPAHLIGGWLWLALCAGNIALGVGYHLLLSALARR